MKQFIQLTGILVIVALAAGLLLAGVNRLTRKPIEYTKKRIQLEAIKKVLPICDNDPAQDKIVIKHNKKDFIFYRATKDGKYVGTAFQASSQKGYAGKINLMVGVNAKDQIQSIAILGHSETPGLGAKIEEDKFKGQFNEKKLTKTRWSVKKDGGDIDQITAATISSRAVVDAIKNGIDVYLTNREKITGQKSGEVKHSDSTKAGVSE